jgi:hypothetical protein
MKSVFSSLFSGESLSTGNQIMFLVVEEHDFAPFDDYSRRPDDYRKLFSSRELFELSFSSWNFSLIFEKAAKGIVLSIDVRKKS